MNLLAAEAATDAELIEWIASLTAATHLGKWRDEKLALIEGEARARGMKL